jgi:hypothetical protein
MAKVQLRRGVQKAFRRVTLSPVSPLKGETHVGNGKGTAGFHKPFVFAEIGPR